MEISTAYPNFVSIKNEQLYKVSLLTRKILPPVFGIATIGWIIGGTIWFDNQSSINHQNVFSKTSAISRSVPALQENILPNNACFNSDSANGRFQALNLFFQKNKFTFTENAELQAYFRDLHRFLEHNPTTKLEIAAKHSITEGSKISKKRLTFISNFLKNKNFNRGQFIFEDRKKTTHLVLADAQNLDNQRVEIRILTP